MKKVCFLKHFLAATILLLTSNAAQSQVNSKDTLFVPHIGQEGKDVIWVPTPDELVAKMLEIAEVKPSDIVVDLGSGDGRTVIAAAKLGAQAIGIEFNPDMVNLSVQNARKAGVEARTKFICTDLFEYDLSKATVITMFLLPQINLKLRPILLGLKPGTRIVSNTFTMDNWEPDFEVTTDDNMDSWYTALMWVVPAKVDGKWKLGNGELEIRQEFQFFYGTYTVNDKTLSVTEGRINGDLINFRINEESYTGKVKGNTISGTVTGKSTKSDWSATLK